MCVHLLVIFLIEEIRFARYMIFAEIKLDLFLSFYVQLNYEITIKEEIAK